MPIPRNAPELLTRRPATRLRLYIHTMFPHIHAHISHPAPLHVSPPATIRAHTHNLLTHTHARPPSAFALARRRAPIRHQPNLPKAATLHSGRQKHSAARRAIADLCDAAKLVHQLHAGTWLGCFRGVAIPGLGLWVCNEGCSCAECRIVYIRHGTWGCCGWVSQAACLGLAGRGMDARTCTF
jgi:hypothetical protein